MFRILGWPGSWSLGSWVTVRFVQSLRLGIINLWHPQKKMTNIFTSAPTVCKNEQCFNCSKTIKSANIWQILRIYPPPILWSSQMYYPLLRSLFSHNVFWQITSYTFWNLLQTGADCKVKQDISETYNHIRSNNSSSKWLLKSDIAWLR